MRSIVIGLVLLFAVFTFVGALPPADQVDQTVQKAAVPGR